MEVVKSKKIKVKQNHALDILLRLKLRIRILLDFKYAL